MARWAGMGAEASAQRVPQPALLSPGPLLAQDTAGLRRSSLKKPTVAASLKRQGRARLHALCFLVLVVLMSRAIHPRWKWGKVGFFRDEYLSRKNFGALAAHLALCCRERRRKLPWQRPPQGILLGMCVLTVISEHSQACAGHKGQYGTAKSFG